MSGTSTRPEPAERHSQTDGQQGTVRVLLYFRVNTGELSETGGEARRFSVSVQREACRRKAEQLGATGVVEFVERGEGLTL